ncbi:MFS transporter [Exiguobacterium aestuarii]|uniref:MFS transporter n=1 Tax=Exiguobacterium aestuarii TaxID=273527 RepID=UPI001CD7017B|nr:MFS transporter [Exiguobacterium aestuarii]MCA0980288.1 MFS transporter [Exiguobacterium aestuarii]
MNSFRKTSALLLVSVGISNLGAWVYFIALNLIVLEMTGSPFAVSVLYVLVPLASLISNLWSGSLIDRVDTRRLMMILDGLRAFLVFSLGWIESLWFIYGIVFLLNVMSSLFESSSLVYMTQLVPASNRQKFNAMKNFVQSSGFILGPMIAGLLFLVGSPTTAIFVNAFALVASVGMLSRLPSHLRTNASIESFSVRLIIEDWKVVIRFASNARYVTIIYGLFCVMTIFMSGLDSLEASFATQVLHLSESRYGFLVSIAGIGIIVGSLINSRWSHRLSLSFCIGFGAIMTPVGYLLFAGSSSFTMASIGFFILTFALAFANTGFLSFYQHHVPVEIMGRFSGVINVTESLFVILLTFGNGLLAEMVGIRPVYLAFSIVFFLVGCYTIYVIRDRSKREYFIHNQIEKAS